MNHYTLDDIRVGMKESFTVDITEDMHDSFTKMSGDVNPMHLDKNKCLRGGVQGSFGLWHVYRLALLHTGGCLSAGRKVPLSSLRGGVAGTCLHWRSADRHWHGEGD